MQARVIALYVIVALTPIPGHARATAQSPAIDAAIKAALPGRVHADLARRAGTYTTVTKAWTQPNAEPVESRGTARLSIALDGRFLHEENDGMTMGLPYKGLRITGYNNASQKYEGVWYHTGSTATMVLSGTTKDNGKTINWIAVFEDQKGVKVTLSATTQFIDADRFVVDLRSNTPQGAEGPRFETTYSRQKP